MYNSSLLTSVILRKNGCLKAFLRWKTAKVTSHCYSLCRKQRGSTLQPTTSSPCASTWWLKYSFLLKWEANTVCSFYLVLRSIITLDFTSRQQHYREISTSMGSHYKGSPKPSLRKAVQGSPVKTSFPASAVLPVQRILHPENIFS